MAKRASEARVIIVGGSISGLTLALTLKKANIDFVVLEKGIIAPQLGASVGLYPTGNIIMKQLGVYQELEDYTYPLLSSKLFDSKANCLNDSRMFKLAAERYGSPFAFHQRSDFIAALHRQISDKSKILVGKEVVAYEENDDIVKVKTADGEVYEGTILVGADEVHSTIRQLMVQASRKELGWSKVPLETSNNGKFGFQASYKVAFAISRIDSTTFPMSSGQLWTTQGKGYSAVTVSGTPGYLFWFLFAKIPHVRGEPSLRFDKAETDALINKHRDMKLCNEYTVGEAWNARVKGNVVAQEERILDQWSRGRIVLVGDAIHKMTINVGLGANCAIEGIVQLANLIYPILSPTSSIKSTVSRSEWEKIFLTYRERHLPRAKSFYELSAFAARVDAQEGASYEFISRCIIPYLGDSIRFYQLCGLLDNAPTMIFIRNGAGRRIDDLAVTWHRKTWITCLGVMGVASFGLLLLISQRASIVKTWV